MILSGLLLTVVCAFTTADVTEAELETGLDEAVALIAAGDWGEARSIILDLAERHAETDYVLLHAHRIMDGLKQCAFWSDNEVPDSEDLMAGEILSYDKRSGKIKVRYRRDEEAYERWKAEQDPDDDTAEYLRELISLLGITSSVGTGDFTYWDGVPMHPIYFAGPYTVEIKGRMPPEEEKAAAIFATPQIVVSCGEEGTYRINYGYPLHGGVGWYSTPSLQFYRGASRKLMDDDDDTPLKLGKLYSVKVNVSSSSITASANGKSVVKCKKQGKSYGQFGFRGCPNVDELIISGLANTAWIDGLSDTWIQENLEAFDQEYDALDDLPESLAERIGEKAEPKSLLEEFPGESHPKHAKHIEAMQEMLDRGRFTAMLSYLESLRESSASPGFREFLKVQCAWRLGKLDEALGGCERVTRDFPDYAPAAVTLAQIQSRLSRYDEALATLEAFIEHQPEEADPRILYTGMLMAHGRFDAARQAMRDAFAAGVPAAELAGAAFMFTRAQDGPEWAETFEYSSRNYVVRSDMSQKICIETSRTLEQSLSMYKRLFGQPDKSGDEPDRYDVYLFSGSAGYYAYTGDLLGSAATGSAGLYSPVLKQLIIWNLPDRAAMMETIRHEGFHQYLDRLLDVTPPTWFNEGTAEYMETAQLQRGKMTPGAPVLGNVNLLSSKDVDWIDLDELLTALPSEFYGNGGPFYAQSWAVVHTLLEGDRSEKAIYKAYLDALLAGKNAQQAHELAFGDQSMKSLLRTVKKHVKKLNDDL